VRISEYQWKKLLKEHKAYRYGEAVKAGKLKEPFYRTTLRGAPGFGYGVYNAFVLKHRRGNHGNASELFETASPRKYVVLIPFKYRLD